MSKKNKPQTSSQSSTEKGNKNGSQNKNECPSGVGKKDDSYDA